MIIPNSNTAAKLIYTKSIGSSEIDRGLFIDKRNHNIRVHLLDSKPFNESMRSKNTVFVGVYNYLSSPEEIQEDIELTIKQL